MRGPRLRAHVKGLSNCPITEDLRMRQILGAYAALPHLRGTPYQDGLLGPIIPIINPMKGLFKGL